MITGQGNNPLPFSAQHNSGYSVKCWWVVISISKSDFLCDYHNDLDVIEIDLIDSESIPFHLLQSKFKWCIGCGGNCLDCLGNIPTEMP